MSHPARLPAIRRSADANQPDAAVEYRPADQAEPGKVLAALARLLIERRRRRISNVEPI